MAESVPAARMVRLGAFEVDLRAGEVRKHGIRLKLQDQPFQILATLLERPGEVVTREELRTKLWPSDTFVDFDHGLNSAVNKLREALGDSADSPRYIETLPRRGYRFIGQIETHPAPAIAAAVERSSGSQPQAALAMPLSRQRSWVRWTLAILGIAAFAFGSVWLALLGGLRKADSGIVASPRIESLAVLPLENLSRDPDQEYFADGMTDELIAQLAKIRALRVISRTSVMRYKHVTKPLPEIAKELSVDAILEGAVMRSGDQVRITAQLIDARTDQHVWAEDYARDMHDILGLQTEVAKDVAREVRVQLSPQETANLSSGFTTNPEAFDLYLRSLASRNGTIPGWQAGLSYAQAAVAKDSNFAKAYSAIADCYLSGLSGRILPPREAMPKARDAATRALAIDDRLSEAHLSYGGVLLLYDWDWSGAEREFKRALELNPGYAFAHMMYSSFLAAVGRTDEAVLEERRGTQLQPGELATCMELRKLLYAHRYEEGAEIMDRMYEQNPKLQLPCVLAGMLYDMKGRYDDAIRVYEQDAARSPEETLPIALRGRAYALAGNKQQAQRALKQLSDLSHRRFVSPYDLAVVYAGLGEKDEAFRCLDRAVSERIGLLVYLKVDPTLDSLRSDPRFSEVTRKVHIPQ